MLGRSTDEFYNASIADVVLQIQIHNEMQEEANKQNKSKNYGKPYGNNNDKNTKSEKFSFGRSPLLDKK